MSKTLSAKIGQKEITIETGKIAKQADGAVTVTMGETIVLVTSVMSKKGREGIDFLPLTVEYQERTYAAGKIPGGFFKREGRPSGKEILTARLIDRPIRPLFPKLMVNEVQIMSMVLSSDCENNSDILALIGASTALSISDIPFDGPIGAVRVGRINNEFVINPTFQELESSDLDLVMVVKDDSVLMLESGSNELSEDIILEAINFGKKACKDVIKLQEELVKKFGKKKRKNVSYLPMSEELTSKVKDEAAAKLGKAILLPSKEERAEAFDALYNELMEKYVTEDSGYSEMDLKNVLKKIEKEAVRSYMLNKKKRVDNRKFEEVRHIECSAGFLPRTHGSGLFTRGQTQSLSVTTLGTSADEQKIDALEGEKHKTFMLHYNFPPFSVGEVKPVRGPGRREIGHGALAERALEPVMPDSEKFPYTVRIVSDILESNGSSSMATVCAGTLSLMDAGVPIKAPVAGIAMGLVTGDKDSIILTDIAGLEDHYGDMDFKVAGTKDGITSVQLDMKISGMSMEMVKKTLKQAHTARMHILEKMNAAIAKPKEELSAYAPRITKLMVNPAKIKDIIGPGGKIIKQIIKDTGVAINIEDDGTVAIASSDETASKKAIDIVNSIVAEAEPGKIYKGKISRLMNFGAFCEILPGKEGLIHVSELSDQFVKNVSEVVKVGQEVTVKVIGIDEQGRINLSIKKAKE